MTSLRRRHRDLQARYERVIAERDNALRDLATERFNVHQMADEYTRLHDDNERLAAEATTREQLVVSLQKRLDDAVGGGAQYERDLDAAGARERARRGGV